MQSFRGGHQESAGERKVSIKNRCIERETMRETESTEETKRIRKRIKGKTIWTQPKKHPSLHIYIQ